MKKGKTRIRRARGSGRMKRVIPRTKDEAYRLKKKKKEGAK